jgi:hypothetical protein
VTPEEKVDAIAVALFGTIESGADYNLDAALDDLRRTGADAVCISTIERVLGQLISARRIIEAKTT